MSRWDPTPGAVSGPERVLELANFFERGGVPVHAWTVVKGTDPDGEARLSSQVLAAGARSLFLDLESHPGFWVGTRDSAARYGRQSRGPGC
jgi:hypothetical protein